MFGHFVPTMSPISSSLFTYGCQGMPPLKIKIISHHNNYRYAKACDKITQDAAVPLLWDHSFLLKVFNVCVFLKILYSSTSLLNPSLSSLPGSKCSSNCHHHHTLSYSVPHL